MIGGTRVAAVVPCLGSEPGFSTSLYGSSAGKWRILIKMGNCFVISSLEQEDTPGLQDT